jgi:hypothetical protein
MSSPHRDWSGAISKENAARSIPRTSRPLENISLIFSGHPPARPLNAQRDAAIMTFAYVPEEDKLAQVVVRCLAERAGTGDGATAVVEPIAGYVPIRDV